MNRVSVIIPAYNQAHFLGKAIQSVFNQTYPDFEIIVVDDGSTDHTAEIIRQFSDPRLQYIRQENKGLSGARNTGIRAAKGEYLSYLDSDDQFLPEKLTRLVEVLDQNPKIGFVAGQAVLIDQDDQPIPRQFINRLPEENKRLLLGNPLHVGSVLLRRSCQERVGFFDENLRSYEDWDMWIRLALSGCPMKMVNRPVSLYRFHLGQMTRNGAQMTTASLAVLKKVFANPGLPEGWRSLHDEAYSNAYLRAAAHSYLAKDYEAGQSNLMQAVKLNPVLVSNQAQLLADKLTGMSELPKTNDPLLFLENIYNHLPDALSILKKRSRSDLSSAAMKIAFESFQRNDYATARQAVLRAIRYQPAWVGNRGAISILVKSLFKAPVSVSLIGKLF